MVTAKQILKGLADQLAVDGYEVLRRFAPQLWLFVGLVVPSLVVLLLYRRRQYRLGRARRVLPGTLALNLAIGCAVLGILLITLSPRPAPENRLDLIPFHPLWSALSGSIDATQVVALFGANILLFVPLGILLPLRWRRLDHPVAILAATGLISGTIEALQYLLDVGRVTQLDDAIFNAFGGLAGWALQRSARGVLAWFRPARRVRQS